MAICAASSSAKKVNKRIYLHHDNASTHFGSGFAPFVAAATDEEWDIRLTKQPANSPDLNINNLSFFRALQSGQWDSVEEAHNDNDGLIEAVQAAFVFLTNQIKLFFLKITGLLAANELS